MGHNYRITALTQTDVTAVKVYYPKEGTIQVHINRDVKCPSGFPPGYFWYSTKRHGPGCPPKWIVKKSTTPGEVSDDSNEEQSNSDNPDVKSEAENSESKPDNEPSELESSPTPQTQSTRNSNGGATKSTHENKLRVELSQCVWGRGV